jgi:hypothetical protein
MRIQLLNTNPIIESVETLRGTRSQNQQNQLERRSEYSSSSPLTLSLSAHPQTPVADTSLILLTFLISHIIVSNLEIFEVVKTLIPVVTRHPSSAWNPWTKKT